MKKTEPKEKTERERENPRAEAPNPQHKQNQHKPRAKPQALEARSRSFKNSIASARPKLWKRSITPHPATQRHREKKVSEMVKIAEVMP
jgi:hypothetical protein